MNDSANPPELQRPFMAERNEQMASQQIAHRDEAQPPAEVTDLSGGLLGVIARAARDPSVDIDKMERLLEMQERVIAREARTAYAVALAELQPLLPIISERGKILNKDRQVQSTYAFWEDVNEQIRPLLCDAGFSLSFRTGRAGSDITVTGVLTHRDGHSEETTITLPSDGSGNKNAVQAVASSTSYGKRYTAFALLNITTKGEDDDGQTATYKDARGEPMPRTKLDGPHSAKTALRNAVHAIIAKVRAAKSAEEITAILKEPANKKTVDQARKDWPALIDGDPKIPEDGGLRGAVAASKADLAPDSAVNVAIDSMKGCTDRLDLERWMDRNEQMITAFDGADSRRFQAAYDEFEAGLTAVDRINAG
jgi:hypothetical protein